MHTNSPPHTDSPPRGRLTLFLGIVPGVATAPVMVNSILHSHPDLRDGRLALLMTFNADTEARTRDALMSAEFAGQFGLSDDVDDLLAMQPDAVLVEDLLETNPRHNRHRTRLQDIEDLRAAGIDVFAAVSVTQFTLARDLIRHHTGILPRNLLPGRLLDEADVIELTDVSPASLIERQQQGDRRLRRVDDGLFSMQALKSLRDLALGVTRRKLARRLADGNPGPVHAPAKAGHVLVLLTRSGTPLRLVRAAHRLAAARGAAWTVAYAESRRDRDLRCADELAVAQAVRQAETAGADIISVSGPDLLDEILDYVHANRVTDIVIGRPRARGLWRLMRRPLADQLSEVAGDITVHMVGEGDLSLERMSVKWRIDEGRPWFHEYLVSAVATFLAAGLIRLAQSVAPPETLSIVMLMAVIYAATAYGFAAALFTSVLGIILFNYFFLEPKLDFIATTPENVVLLAVFVVVAGVTSNLAGRLHDQAKAAQRRERHTAALFRLAREVASAPTAEDVLRAVVRQLDEVLNAHAALLLPRPPPPLAGGGPQPLDLAYPKEMDLSGLAPEIIRQVHDEGRPAGPGTGLAENLPCLLWPLRTPNGPVGVAVLADIPRDALDQPQFRRRLESLAGLSAVAIERMMLSREIESARLTAQTEGLRAALLSSISHDLRTPLASIIGSATSLISFGETYTEEVRKDLLGTILEEAERLNRFVGNLLQMTKLESGAITPKRQWVDLDDLIGTTVERMERRLVGHRIVTEVAPGLPPLYVDFVLMENVLTNLLDNAVKYSPSGSVVTVRSRLEEGDVVVEVEDQGVGIAPEDHAHVFDKFFRVYARDTVVAGTGLGLAICKGIVESHGGSIELESDGPGTGSTFRIRLPVDTLPQDVASENAGNA